MNQILCSTGALIGRPNGRNYRLLRDFARCLRCDGFEFMMYGTWYGEVDALVSFLLSLGLNIPVMHCEKNIGESISKGGDELQNAFNRFEINAQIARAIGAKKMVMHLWDGRTSDSFFHNNLAACDRLRCMAAAQGVELLIENVVCIHESPMERWSQLKARYPEVKLIFDTKMAAFHGQLDELYADEYAWLWQNDHIRHFHVNDYAGGYKDWANLRTLPIGKGHIDFERFFSFVRETGYTGAFTVESTAFNDRGVVNTPMLNREFDFIRAHLNP